MPKEPKIYLEDIIEAIERIETYTDGIEYQEFLGDRLIQDGVERNLITIGEAVSQLPDEVKRKYSEIEWRKISGLRNIVVHAYSSVDEEIVWDVTENKLAKLKQQILEILSKMD